MITDNVLRYELNDIYKPICDRADSIGRDLLELGYTITKGFYNIISRIASRSIAVCDEIILSSASWLEFGWLRYRES